jgi:hypothetical protein
MALDNEVEGVATPGLERAHQREVVGLVEALDVSGWDRRRVLVRPTHPPVS